MSSASIAQDIIAARTEMRILPAGDFRTNDGRPKGIPSWRMNAEIARRVIQASLTGTDILIDYEHQSTLSSKNGQPVPAAGWFNALVWQEGFGLIAAGIEWNQRAKSMIAAREYRFISPTFSFDPNTGDVTRIISVAITNSPALPCLTDLSQAALCTAAVTAPVTPTASLENQRGDEMLRMMLETPVATSTSPLKGLGDRLAALNKRMYGLS